MKPKLEKATIHILRNPFGFSEDQVRRARLNAADVLEHLVGSPSRLVTPLMNPRSVVIVATNTHKKAQLLMERLTVRRVQHSIVMRNEARLYVVGVSDMYDVCALAGLMATHAYVDHDVKRDCAQYIMSRVRTHHKDIDPFFEFLSFDDLMNEFEVLRRAFETEKLEPLFRRI